MFLWLTLCRLGSCLTLEAKFGGDSLLKCSLCVLSLLPILSRFLNTSEVDGTTFELLLTYFAILEVLNISFTVFGENSRNYWCQYGKILK